MNITQDLKELGVHPGDLLLIHSDIGKAPIQDVLMFYQGVQRAIEPGGTVAFPNFNFDFCQGKPFDYRSTPSKMGLLTELARRDPKARRIYHPIYSFALLGERAGELSKIHNVSAYADDSFFGELRRSNGKILLLNIPFRRSMTFFHHIEEILGCDYRYMKDFTGEIIDSNGNRSIKTYKMLVRDLERGVNTHLDPIEEYLESLGVVKKGKIGTWPVKLMRANEVFEATKNLLEEKPHFLMRIIEPKKP